MTAPRSSSSTPVDRDALGAFLDLDERHVCAEVACVVCVLAPREGESDAEWHARLRTEATRQIGADECVNGHPWLPETTRMNKDRRWGGEGFRVCVLCLREAQRRTYQRRKALRSAS